MLDARGPNGPDSHVATMPAPHAVTVASRTDAHTPPAVTRVVAVGGAMSMLIGGVYLAAWLTGAAPAWSAAGRIITMKTNMALALVMAAAALLLLNGKSLAPLRRAAGIIASAVVIAIGVLTLAQHLLRVDLGIDQLIATEPAGAAATVSPNRIGPPGSASLALLGSGLLAFAWRRRIAVYLGLATCVIVLVPAIGLLYGIGPLYGTVRTGIAWPTVVALFVLAGGLMLAASGGAGAVLWRDDPGGVLLRRLLLPTVLIPLVLGYLRVQGERQGLYDTAIGTGLFALSLILLFSTLLWRSGAQLSATDAVAKRAADALREREGRLLLFVEHAPAAVAMFDRDMRYLVASRRYLSDYRLSVQDVIGRSHYGVFPEIPERWREIHRRCLAGAMEKCDEDPFPRPDGTVDWIRWEIRPWHTAAGEIGGIILFSEVITERRRSVEALRESEERYRSLFEHMNEGLAYCRMLYDGDRPVDFVYLNVNSAFEALTGLKGVAGKRVSEVIPGILESDPGLLERYGRVARQGNPERFEVYVESLHQWLAISAYSPAKDHFVAAFHIITERKQGEERLRASEERLRLAQEAARVGSFEWDIQTGVNSWSPELEAMYGLPRGGFAKSEAAWESLVHPDDRTEAMRRVEEAIEAGAPMDAEWRVVWPDGSVHWISGRWQVFKDASGKPLRMTGINIDVTERKRGEELRASEAALREGDRQKNQFLAMLSHELRNPLAPIRNSLYILQRAAPGGEQARRAQAVIDRQIGHMTWLIDDLLDVTRITRGKIRLQRERLDLNDAGAAHGRGPPHALRQERCPAGGAPGAGRGLGRRRPSTPRPGGSQPASECGQVHAARGEGDSLGRGRPRTRAGGRHGARHGRRDPARDAASPLPGLHAGGFHPRPQQGRPRSRARAGEGARRACTAAR